MFEKLWKKAGTRFVIAYFFFMYALYMMIKIVLMHFPGPNAETSGSYQFGWVESFYLAPVIAIVMGYLFFKSGKRIQKANQQSENES